MAQAGLFGAGVPRWTVAGDYYLRKPLWIIFRVNREHSETQNRLKGGVAKAAFK